MKNPIKRSLYVALGICLLIIPGMPEPLSGQAPETPTKATSQPVPSVETCTDPVDFLLKRDTPPDVDEIEHFASVLLHLGLVTDTNKLLQGYFVDRPNASAVSPVAAYLWSECFLLKHDLGQSVPERRFESPMVILEEQQKTLSAALEKVRLAIDRLDAERTRVDSSRYTKLRSLFLTLRARVHMTQADSLYRLRGASLLGQAQQNDKSQLTVATYGNARQDLYEALLIGGGLDARSLALDLDNRLRWIRDGRFFNGLRFFEVDPVRMGSPSTGSLQDTTTTLGALKASRDELGRLEERQQAALQEARSKALKIGLELRKQAHIGSLRKQDRARDLMRELRDLEQKVKGLDRNKNEMVFRHFQALQQQAYSNNKVKTELKQRLTGLIQQRSDILREIATAVQELSKVAKSDDLQAIPGSHLPVGQLVEGLQKLRSRADLQKAIDNFLTSGNSDLQKLANALEQAQGGMREAQSLIDGEKLKLIKQEIEQKKARFLEEVKSFESNVAKIETAIQNALQNGQIQAEQFRKQLEDAITTEIENKRKAVEKEIAKVESLVQEAFRRIEDVQKGAKAAEAAMMAARTAILAAGNVPSGIITGMVNGILTERPKAMMEAAKAGSDLVRHALDTLQSIADAKERLHRLESSLADYRSKLAAINMDEVKRGIQKQLDDVAARGQQEVGKLKAQVLQRKEEIQQRFVEMARLDGDLLRVQKDAIQNEVRRLEAVLQQRVAQRDNSQIEIRQAQQDALFRAARVETLTAQLTEVDKDIEKISAELAKFDEKRTADQKQVSNLSAQKMAALNEEQRDLVERIEALHKELEAVEEGKTDRPLEVPVEELAAMTGGPSATDMANDRRHQLGIVNRHLFHFANWLYLMSRNPAALEWAVCCTSLQEATLARDHLNDLFMAHVARGIGAANPQYFSVEMTSDDLIRAYPSINDDGVAFFTVAPQLADFRSTDSNRSVFHRVNDVGELDQDIFSPLPLSRGLVFAPAIGTVPGEHIVLWDAYVIPAWKDRGSIQASLQKVALLPVGPTQYLRGNRIEGMPVVFPDELNPRNQIHEVKAVDEAHKNAWWRFNLEKALTEGTIRGINNPSVLGRGLGNTWRIELPEAWTKRDAHAPGFDRLVNIRVIFAFLVSPRKQKVEGQSPTSVTAAVSSGPILKSGGVEHTSRQQTQPCDLAWSHIETMAALLKSDLTQFHGAAYQRQKAYDKRQEPLSDKEKDALAIEFSATPVARETRLEILMDAAVLLPSYSELSPDEAGRLEALPAAKAQFLEHTEKYLVDPWKAFPSNGGPAPQDRFEKAVNWVIEHEMVLNESRAVLGPIELGRIFQNIEDILLCQSKPSILTDLKARTAEFEAAVNAVRGVLPFLDKVTRLVNRLDFDRHIAEEEERTLKAIGECVDKLTDNEQVNRQLREHAKLYEKYNRPSNWLATAINAPSPAGRTLPTIEELRLYLTVQRLEELRREYQLKLLQVQTPRKGPQ